MVQRIKEEIVDNISVSLSREDAKKIITHWTGGYPIRGYSIEKLKPILINPSGIEKYINDIYSTLRYFNYSCIIGIVGELGSGKTQLGYLLESSLRSKDPNLAIDYISLGDPADVHLISSKIDELSSPGILIVDEIDAVLAQLAQKEDDKRHFVHLLAGYLVGKSKNQKGFVLLLTQRSINELQRLNDSLRRIIVKDIVRYLGRLDRLDNSKVGELASKILGLMIWSGEYPNLNDFPEQYLELLVDFAVKYAELIGKRTIGPLIKMFTEVFEIISSYSHQINIGATDRGRILEDIFRKYLKNEFKSISFKVNKGDYVAYIVKATQTIVGKPDIQYNVYPGKYPTGRPILKVYLEIKAGSIENVRRSKDQLLLYAQEAPLLIVWIGRGELNELEDFISMLDTKNIIDYLYIPESIIMPLAYLNDPYEAFESISSKLEIREDIQMKLEHNFYNVTTEYLTQSKKKEIRQVQPQQPKMEEAVSMDLGSIANRIIAKLKPYEKDGKRIVLGITKKIVLELLRREGINISDILAEHIASSMLNDLAQNNFLERKSLKTFYTIKVAWNSRRNEALNIIKKHLESVLKRGN